MNIVEIPIEPLSAQSFAPYGWLLKAGDEPDYYRVGLSNLRLPFASEDALRLQVMRYSNRDMRLSMFERHVSVTEARHPIGPAAAVLVVARERTESTLPDPGCVKAFLLDGQTGIMFNKGVWHGLDCFPARTDYVDYLFLSDAATEDEIEGQGQPRDGQHTHVYDFAAVNTLFEVTDPKGLLT